MPVIKVRDIAFGRLQSPDLGEAEEFLLDFGMVRAARTKDTLYMRGTDPAAYLHVTQLGEPKFLGMAFYAASEEDLDRLAKVDGASKIESLDAPGGGKRVRLRDPHGFAIEVVHGIADSEPLPVRRNVVNFGTEKFRRAGELTRLPGGPAQVKRMGHGVIATTDLKKTLAWYRETLGFLCSDDVWAGAIQHRFVLQPCRLRRHLCRSPRLLHDERPEGGPQSFLLRGARFRRRDDGS
jgi:hypothetical protein